MISLYRWHISFAHIEYKKKEFIWRVFLVISLEKEGMKEDTHEAHCKAAFTYDRDNKKTPCTCICMYDIVQHVGQATQSHEAVMAIDFEKLRDTTGFRLRLLF